MKFKWGLIFLGIAIVLPGCLADNETMHSYTVDQTDTATGLMLKASENLWITFPQMVDLYVDTETCMGLIAPGPTVYFKNFEEWFGWIGGWGFYTQNTIYINTYENEYTGRTRSLYTDTETLRHEYVHHVLFHITGSADGTHSSEMFTKCGPGPNVNN